MSDYGILDVIKDELTGKADYVDPQTYVNRIETCKKCEHFKNIIPLTGGSCGLCGCFIKSKNKYRASQCPDKPPRWLAIPLKPM